MFTLIVFKAVDWNEMANENNYMKSAGSTKSVGKNVAAVIDHLVLKKNANIDDIHIIGHSLGENLSINYMKIVIDY